MDAQADVVVVEDGSSWRGEIREAVENDHMTLRLSDGATARIRWSAIQSITRKGVSVQMPGPPQKVHVDAGQDVALERYNPYATRFDYVCHAPCDLPVVTGVAYRVTGARIRPSEAFTLRPSTSPRLRLVVEEKKRSSLYTGIGLAGVGGALTLAGLVLMSGIGGSERDTSSNDNRTAMGGSLIAVGLLVAIPGLVLLGGSSPSRVRASF